ncbi:MAG: 50S ribosomal protein L11 methyltransferase [Chitinophagaceae bacterium]|nr:MAG: 50S ribosomal protein L11 methyltransferase [Chitinophagaceae bacterium]
MDVYTKVVFKTTKPGEKDLLIGLLSELNYEGFEEEGMMLSAYVPQPVFDEAGLRATLRNIEVSYTLELIQPVNWNEEWERNFIPVNVGDFCCIRAAFHPGSTEVLHDIVITPRMSFGTGHHATTYLMVEEMATLNFTGARVLDFGTGTGVLAIDNDSWSIENAADNIIENACRRILVQQASALQGNDMYDIILANINRNVLLEQMGSILQHLNPNGVVVMSGLLTGDLAMIEVEAEARGMKPEGSRERDGWVSIRFTAG